MADAVFFAEDSNQENFGSVLINRVASECAVNLSVRSISSRGGVPRMMGELRAHCGRVLKGRETRPDLILVVRDSNCTGVPRRRREVLEFLPPELRDLAVILTPDPHIERWFMLDGRAFYQATGAHCDLPAYKCDKEHYKKLFRAALATEGISPPLGGAEFAEPIARAIDIRVGRIREASFESALGDLRDSFARLRGQG